MERAEIAVADGRLTLEQWAALDEDTPGELVDGRLEEEEEPDFVHDLIVMWLGQVIRNWLGARGGSIAASDVKFAVGPRRGRKPDASVYLPGSPLPPRHGIVRVPPDILIEVITPTPRDRRRDRLAKMDDYAEFGVRWYWILDPEARTLEIFELHQGLYARVLGAEARIDRVPGCEGLVLDLDALWAEIDQLPAEAG